MAQRVGPGLAELELGGDRPWGTAAVSTRLVPAVHFASKPAAAAPDSTPDDSVQVTMAPTASNVVGHDQRRIAHLSALQGPTTVGGVGARPGRARRRSPR